MRGPTPFLAIVLCALACSVDGSDDVADTQSSDGSETVSGTETGSGGPQDFPPVQCENVTCAEGDLCVEAGAYCDFTGGRPKWVIPTGVCTPYPSKCAGLKDHSLEKCLWETVCESVGDLPGDTRIEQGLVECPDRDLDCFEFP